MNNDTDTLIQQLEAQRATLGEAEWARRMQPVQAAWAEQDAERDRRLAEAVRVSRIELLASRLATARALAEAVRQAAGVAASLSAIDAEVARLVRPSTAARLRNGIAAKLDELDLAAFLREAEAADVTARGEL